MCWIFVLKTNIPQQGFASFQHLEMSSGRVDAATRGAKQFAGLAITVPEEEPVGCLVYVVN